MWLVHKRKEGDRCFNGINWYRDKATTIAVVLRLGRFFVYYRRRSPWIKTERRNIFQVYWATPFSLSGIEYEFDTNSFTHKGKRITVEVLIDIIDQYGGPNDVLDNTYSVDEIMKIHGRKD